MRKMAAKEACGQRVVSFPRVVKVADVVSILQSNKHNGFPVIDHTRNGDALVIGLMLRSHMLVLLQSKVDFQHSPLPNDTRAGSRPIRHTPSEFVKPVSSKGLTLDDNLGVLNEFYISNLIMPTPNPPKPAHLPPLDDIHLSPDDWEMYIDLAPFLNPSPYIVPKMSLTKVYNLFRQLGLRYIFVVPRPSRVIGLITRTDLLIEDNEESATVELQSTSVRAWHHDRRVSMGNGDAERPLLNGLLVQGHTSS
ncbi:chloride channel protein CLC-d-like [Quercus suber]|uniref:chloride channel protein CLC-d-like n=1 Tax=Quercus suber TaxID=58331 RepID=UPI0032DFD6D2